MNQYKKKIKKSNRYREFVEILNGKLQLSHREMDLLTMLVRINTEWKPRIEGEDKNILSTDNRRLIMKETMINKSNLSKYINIMKERGILVFEDNKYALHPMVIPNINENKITVIFNLEIEENV